MLHRSFFFLLLLCPPGLALAADPFDEDDDYEYSDNVFYSTTEATVVASVEISVDITFDVTTAVTSGEDDQEQNCAMESAKFLHANQRKVTRDIARGEGEYLYSLAKLLRVKPEDYADFSTTARLHFSEIFPEPGTNAALAISKIKSLNSGLRIQLCQR